MLTKIDHRPFSDGQPHKGCHGILCGELVGGAFALGEAEGDIDQSKCFVRQCRYLLSCEDGNYETVFTKAIEYTDFPLPKIALWFSDNVILLPSEY